MGQLGSSRVELVAWICLLDDFYDLLSIFLEKL